MTLRDDLLPIMHDTRQIMQDLGFRTNTLAIITRVWSGEIGDTDAGFDDGTPVVIAPLPRIRQLSSKEVASSGGQYEMGDVRIDKITPAFSGGGYTPEQIAPEIPPGTTDTEVIYRITGTLDGDYARVALNTDRALGYSMVVRRMTRTP